MASIQMTGMASGLDTKSIVESMLKNEKTKVERVNQNKQILEWRQELYREMIGSVRDFSKKYFDPLNKETYIMGSASLSGIKASSSVDNTVASVLANSNSKVGNFKLEMNQMATPAKFVGKSSVNQVTIRDNIKIPFIIDNDNNDITIDGKKITLDNKSYDTPEALARQINEKIEGNSELKGKYVAEVDDKGALTIAKKIVVDEKNSSLEVQINGKKHTVELEKKPYTLDELAKEIESKVKNLGDETKDFKVKVENGKISTENGTINKEYKLEQPQVEMEKKGTLNSNGLSFNRGFLEGKNSELVLSVRGQTPVIVDLKDLKTDGKSNEDILKEVSKKVNEQSKIVTSEVVDGKLVFKSNSKDQIIISGSAASSLGIGSSLDVSLDVTKEKMSNLLKFDSGDKKVEFQINGQTFKYDFDSTEEKDGYLGGKNLTIKQVFSDISAKAKVNISYNSISRGFSIESKETGKEISLEASDVNGKFFETLFGEKTISEKGKNSEVVFSDNEGNFNTFEFSSNNFNLSGINFDIKSMPTEPIKVNVVSDTDKTVELMKGFVEDYNKIIEDLNTKSKERTNSKYKPLNEEQKKEMSEKEIELWEKKAKEGLLGNQSEIENFMYKLRNAIFSPVGGITTNLRDIGLNTSKDYKEGGKIQFDEDKFKSALAKDPQLISEMFTKTSDSGHENYDPNLTLEERKNKDADQGIFRRINDVINDFTRTTRNKDGKKGIFLEIAGIKGDSTLNENTISREIKEQDKKIDKLNDLIASREDRYYKQFTRLETALTKLQAQSSMFMPQ